MNNRPYVTTDFGLAAYLVMNGMRIVKAIKASGNTKSQIVFFDDDRRAKLESDYKHGEGSGMIAYQFNKATKIVRNALKDAVEVDNG